MSSFLHQDFNVCYEKLSGYGSRNILFIHGNLASKEWWHPSIELLRTEKGTGTLLSVDWRGYGDSKGIQSAEQINMWTNAEDIIALIRKHGLENVHLVGHSTGGLIAMMCALRAPELISSLVLLDSVGGEGLILEHPEEMVLAHFDKMSQDKDYCRMVLAATIQDCDPMSSSFDRLLNLTWKCDPPMWQGVIKHLAHDINIEEQMPSIKQKTLILHGEKDLVLPLQMSERIHSLLPHSELKVIKGHGHSLNMEDPKLFVSHCQQFWQTL